MRFGLKNAKSRILSALYSIWRALPLLSVMPLKKLIICTSKIRRFQSQIASEIIALNRYPVNLLQRKPHSLRLPRLSNQFAGLSDKVIPRHDSRCRPYLINAYNLDRSVMRVTLSVIFAVYASQIRNVLIEYVVARRGASSAGGAEHGERKASVIVNGLAQY